MKITVDVDCTPLEARQFMGLPDVEPMQKAAMAEIEKRMMAELERFSPEALFKAWLPIAGMNAEWLQEFLKRVVPLNGRELISVKAAVLRSALKRFCALPPAPSRSYITIRPRNRGNPDCMGWLALLRGAGLRRRGRR